MLANAEKISVIAEKFIKKEYPSEKINLCWQDLMFNQFHDILGGTCIKSAYFDARNLHGRAIQTVGEILHFALQNITNKIKMPGKNQENPWNIVVWNLNGFDINTAVEAEVQWAWEFDWYKGGLKLEDADGNVYPCQIITELSVIPGFRSRFLFKAPVPAMGYRAFKVRQTNKAAHIQSGQCLEKNLK